MDNDNYLTEEYKLAHEELRTLWELYWRQGSYFLTFNGVLIAFTSITLALAQNYFLIFIISVFGISITLLWLFHGNRFFLYIREVERKMREAEKDKSFIMKLKSYQKDRYVEKDNLSLLEKYSGSRIRNTILPGVTIIIWSIILTYVTYQLLVPA